MAKHEQGLVNRKEEGIEVMENMGDEEPDGKRAMPVE